MVDNAIGMIVIGQSPRPDIADELTRFLPPTWRVFQVGALDDVSSAEIDLARPRNGMNTLFTTLPNGDSIRISKTHVVKGIQRRVLEFEAKGVPLALLCCSGAFPGLVSPIRLIEPDRVLTALAAAALPVGRLGLLFPLAEQFEQLAQKFERDGIEIIGEAVTPGSDTTAVIAAANALAQRGPDLIVMDCMGYTAADRENVRLVYGGPILLAISAAGRVLEELLS